MFPMEPELGAARVFAHRRRMAGAIPIGGNRPFTMMGESPIHTCSPTATAMLRCVARTTSLVFA
jgi:hypothetical protein